MIKETILKLLKIDGLVDHVSHYLETRLQLFKLEIKEDLIGMLSKIILYLLLSMVVVFFLIMASLGFAYFLGTKLGMMNGFFIVAGLYLLIAVILILFREKISSAIEKLLTDIAQQKKE